MTIIHHIYLISDSTGETLDRIFMALKAQFKNFKYEVHNFSFTRTENQINKILNEAKEKENSIILYTVVENKLAKHLTLESENKNIPCFGVLGDLILNFSKILHQKATHIPSGQHALNDEYYERVEAIQFTMNHDDGNMTSDIKNSDIVLLGVSRTSKTPTSMYLANRGYKTTNIPIIPEKNLPEELKLIKTNKCVVGLICDAERLADVRRNRAQSMHEERPGEYTNNKKIISELENSKKIFKINKWPTIDVTRKSVEETAASIIKIYEIKNKKNV